MLKSKSLSLSQDLSVCNVCEPLELGAWLEAVPKNAAQVLKRGQVVEKFFILDVWHAGLLDLCIRGSGFSPANSSVLTTALEKSAYISAIWQVAHDDSNVPLPVATSTIRE
ncbi:hypothetical protein D3C77_658160 [compost metagenome]